jgi:hypothetical protein
VNDWWYDFQDGTVQVDQVFPTRQIRNSVVQEDVADFSLTWDW